METQKITGPLIPISEAVEVSKSFSARSGLHANRGHKRFVQAVDRCSLQIYPGQSVGLVGESGCGKSTLGRLMLRLETPTAGEIIFDGVNITRMKGASLRKRRRQMQIIFQDPASSLNPRFTVEATLREAIQVHKGKHTDKKQIKAHIAALLNMVGLPFNALNRLPHEFSSGGKQQIAIARALAVEPRFLIADEPVTSLDLSSQEQILSLLETVKRELNVAFLLIGHDMNTVKRMCSQVAVMYLGRIVEFVQTGQLFENPSHPYSKALLASQLSQSSKGGLKLKLLQGDPPSPLEPPDGCHFHPRCPYSDLQCSKIVPKPRKRDDGRIVRCHFDFEGEKKITPKEVSESFKLTP